MTPGCEAARADSEIRVRLAVSEWRIRCRLQPDGRTVIEVSDETGVLAGLVASTRLPIVSADAGWRGITRSAGGESRWWALAIGHAPADAGRPAVTFMRGLPGSRPATVRPVTMGGVWVAAVTGRYTTARCELTSPAPSRLAAAAQPALHLARVTTRHPRSALRTISSSMPE